MWQGMNRLRQQCQELLVPGERIELEAEAGGWIGPVNVLGAGRAYLTNSRLIWLRRATPLIRPLLFWIPDVVQIPFSSVESLRVVRQFPKRAWLRLRADGKEYGFRLGKGPFPLLRDNPLTTERWFEAMESRFEAPGSTGG